MKTLASLSFIALFQAGFTLAIIGATQGGGSFVGLGAMLMAVMGIPATALVNFIRLRRHAELTGLAHFGRSFLPALVLPALQLGLMAAVSVFRL